MGGLVGGNCGERGWGFFELLKFSVCFWVLWWPNAGLLDSILILFLFLMWGFDMVYQGLCLSLALFVSVFGLRFSFILRKQEKETKKTQLGI